MGNPKLDLEELMRREISAQRDQRASQSDNFREEYKRKRAEGVASARANYGHASQQEIKELRESKKQEEKDKRDYRRIEILRDVIMWSLILLGIALSLGLLLFFLSRCTDIGAALTDTRTEFHFLSLLTAGLLAIITTCIGLIGGSSIK
ncbi:hypothetical protein COTS27_00882 [Spirochaetota bacterium]|nr:hypothetical protein COTS27_00882 [Spirochaetota bacterium]